jgi:hypothetical protein
VAPAAEWRLWRLCWRGELPLEALAAANPAQRDALFTELWKLGWSDVEIAAHTRMTTYTTGRIRQRLGLAAHRDTGRAVA